MYTSRHILNRKLMDAELNVGWQWLPCGEQITHITRRPLALRPSSGCPASIPVSLTISMRPWNIVSFIYPPFEACNIPGLHFHPLNYCNLLFSLQCLWCPFQQPNLVAPLKLWLHRAGQARPWVRQPWQQSASRSWSNASSASSASSASRIVE